MIEPFINASLIDADFAISVFPFCVFGVFRGSMNYALPDGPPERAAVSSFLARAAHLPRRVLYPPFCATGGRVAREPGPMLDATRPARRSAP